MAKHDSAEHRDERMLRLAIAGFGAVLLLAIIASVHLSTLDVSFGSVVYGSGRLWRGHHAAFRVAAYDSRSADLIGPVIVRAALRDLSGVRARAEAGGERFAELSLQIPPDTDARAMLDLEVETPEGADRLSLELRSFSTPGTPRGRVAPASEVRPPSAPAPRGTLRAALYPRAGRVVAGVENVITGLLERDGAPAAPATLHSDRMGIHSDSDALGLFTFAYTPPPGPQTLTFALGEGPAPELLELPMRVVPAGMLLETRPAALVEPGSPLRLRVRALPFRDPVLLDVWAGGSLLVADSARVHGGLIEAEVTVPEDLEGFLRVEAYRSLAAPEDSRSTALLWVSRASRAQAAAEALDALARMPGGDPVIETGRHAGGEARARLCALALSRFEPEVAGAGVLASSLESRAKSVSTEKARLRGGVHLLFALTIVLGLALALAWVIRHQLRVKRSLRAVMEDGLAAGEAIDTEAMRRMARIGHVVDLFLVLLALVLFAYGIYVLLTRMTWQ